MCELRNEASLVRGLVDAVIPKLVLRDYDGSEVDLRVTTLRGFVLCVQPGRAAEGQRGGGRDDTLRDDQYRALRDDFAAAMPNGAILTVSSDPDPVGFLLHDEWAKTRRNEDHELAYRQLADPELRLADDLPLPTFEQDGCRLFDRITLLGSKRRIRHVFYPVDARRDARQALAWWQLHR